MRLTVVFLMACYSFGALLHPPGNLSYSLNLPEMYKLCAGEDPDITPLDFIFEHLLNLEEVIDHFEHGKEKDEKPHQASLNLNSGQSVAIPSPYHLPIPARTAHHGIPVQQYPVTQNRLLPDAHFSRVFRPPVC